MSGLFEAVSEKQELSERAMKALQGNFRFPKEALQAVLFGWMPMEQLKQMTEFLEQKIKEDC